jgi:hypothetical protein
MLSDCSFGIPWTPCVVHVTAVELLLQMSGSGFVRRNRRVGTIPLLHGARSRYYVRGLVVT